MTTLASTSRRTPGRLALLGLLALLGAEILRADPGPWEKTPTVPAESAFLHDRLSEPQNHFLLDGTQGFISGRTFYQFTGESAPFIWFTHPFLQYAPDRDWQDDSLPLVVNAHLGHEFPSSPLTTGSVNW